MSEARPFLLVVDDEPDVVQLVATFARKVGFDVVTAASGEEALQALRRQKAAVALVDLRMHDVDGLEVLRRIRAVEPDCQVILMTGHASVDTAIEAIKHGAMDYLSKPFDFGRLESLLLRVRTEMDRRHALFVAESQIVKQLEFCGMVGRGPVMLELFDRIRRFAPHVRTALITGETGTGKELVARALHEAGPRSRKNFVTVNCSAVVESLFESELFGHARGAFTGATAAKAGLFEVADRGTLFLDEIGELPMTAQAKLLRAIETGEIQRVGALDMRRVDVRVIAATNRDLRAECAAGRFREDLFYRLSVVELNVTPLRDRREDIPYLTSAFVKHFATQFNKPIVGPNPAAERVLSMAQWPGNVRELRNTIERICMLTGDDFFTEKETVACLPPQPALDSAPTPASRKGDPHLLADAERTHIVQVLAATAGNKLAAAKLLGVSRRALYRKLDRLGIR